jgi:hypothetical protein
VRAGLGFFLPEEDPKADAARATISRPTVQRTSAAAAAFSPGGPRASGGAFVLPPAAPPGATPETAPAEPVEDTSTDWQVDFAFKVKLGEKPAPPAAKRK